MRVPRTRLGVLALIVGAGAAAAWLAPETPARAQTPGMRHRMTKITETIYRADNPGTIGANSTSWVFLNDADVLVTDSEGTVDAARSLLAGVATITDKPVRYLVDTHFHIDHAYGNSALPSSVQIIGSDFTHRMLLDPAEARQGVTARYFGADAIPPRIEAFRQQLAAEADPAKRAAIEQQIAQQEGTLAYYRTNYPLQPPNLTVKQQMSIWSGAKEFRILYLGRAHTAGDVVVYVPSEKAVANGDILFKATVGWQGDAYPNDHPQTLEALRQLDLELALPGHGEHIAGKANIAAAITNLQQYLREEWRQTAAAKRAGLTPEGALATMDFSSFRPSFGNSSTPSLYAVRRIYDIIDGKADQTN